MGTPPLLSCGSCLKLVFVGGFVTATAIAAAGARRAARRHGGSVNQFAHEVRGLLLIRAALGIAFYGSLVLWLFDAPVGTWICLPFRGTLRWAGASLLFPTLAVFAWSFGVLGTNYRGGVGLHDAHQLVTTGPYRLVRHPIYLCFVIIMCLVFMISANWVLGLSGLLLVSSIAAIRIPIEERELSARFGAAWTSYRNQTGLLLPRFRRVARIG